MAGGEEARETGLLLPSSGCRITHGASANVKTPFPKLMPDLVMHELSAPNDLGFKGPLGIIHFTPSIRLPRHIHMTPDRRALVAERILVLHGVGLVELAGDIYVVAPDSLVEAKGGVPHTWTACPEGVRLPDGTVSEGRFTMVYEYEDATQFFPTKSTEVVKDVAGYEAWEGDLEKIRFPALSSEEVVARAKVVMDGEMKGLELA